MIARPIFLTGLMGTGKSAVGRRAAELAGLPFLDLDQLIEAREGTRIADIFAGRGEQAFRAIERAALHEQLADPTPRVVALGGGTLLDRAVRLKALDAATVVALDAGTEELARRLSGDQSRPLLANGDAASRLRELRETRADAYLEAHGRVDTTGLSPSQAAEKVLEIARRDPIPVPLRDRTYVVEIAPGGLSERLEASLSELSPTRTVYVTDTVVAPLVEAHVAGPLARADAAAVRVVLPTGERHKTLSSVENILRAAVEAPIDRRAVLVGVGGGVITDMAGLAAALALRGIRWIAVPTTVLAMVDASVGGKTAVDLGAAKNAVGAFHQPSRVIVDPTLTATESDRQFRSGLAEVLKTALLGDPRLYEELRAPGGAERLAVEREPLAVERAIRSSIRVKAGVVGRDERESGERAHLNFGHTIGHALEAEGGYERLTHGESVALGTIAALRIGAALGLTPAPLVGEVTELLARLRLPTALDEQPLERALRWVGYDKKRLGKHLRMVFVRAPGRVEVVPVSPSELPRLLAPS